jgi:hypothetical protein
MIFSESRHFTFAEPTASLLRHDFVEYASSIKLSRGRVKELCPMGCL